jgi:hypothetical protein
MQVFTDSFVPIEVGEWWFGSQLCPACDTHSLHPVANLNAPRWLCSSCGRCWTPLHGHLDRVDPWTCAGCATHDRRECVARLQRDAPRTGLEHSPTTSEMRDAPDRALTDHWEFLARVVQAQRLICVQANCTADDALILMRERARATDHRVVEIAEDVVAHRMWFD